MYEDERERIRMEVYQEIEDLADKLDSIVDELRATLKKSAPVSLFLSEGIEKARSKVSDAEDALRKVL